MSSKLERTRRKTIFGTYMRALRERCQPKITPESVANEIHTAKTTITRMESGLTVPGFLLTSTLLGIYGASSEERARAEQLRLVAKADTTRIENVVGMSEKYRAFRRDEVEAVRERTFDTVVIPGLLQTPGYAREIWSGARNLNKANDAEAFVAERASRQSLLTLREPPLVLHSLIDEMALTRPIGSPSVRVEQLDHLISMATKSNITVQVVPKSAGAYGPMTGPWVLLDYGPDDGPNVAHAEYVAGGETIDNVENVDTLSDVWDEMVTHALSPKQTINIIRTTRDSVWSDE
jgi:Domain of unknown function (DUF5753)